MEVMTFGASCSPSSAHNVKTLNTLKFWDSDSRAVKFITDYHYVDDYVDSFVTERSSSPTVETVLGPG